VPGAGFPQLGRPEGLGYTATVNPKTAETIVINGREVRIRPLHTEEEIGRRVGELAAEVSSTYDGGDLVVVGILKGAFVFLADLLRRLEMPCRCDFMALGSYGSGTVSSGKVDTLLDLRLPVAGRDVLVVEDIVDTGRCLRFALDRIQREDPRSLRVCTLLDKPSRRVIDVPLDWVGFTVPDRFIVGYGIDLDERFRDLPYLACLEGM